MQLAGLARAAWVASLGVRLGDTTMGHLLALELMEIDGSLHAWVSWVQQAGGRPIHKVVSVPQDSNHSKALSPTGRRVRGRDGVIRLWPGEIC